MAIHSNKNWGAGGKTVDKTGGQRIRKVRVAEAEALNWKKLGSCSRSGIKVMYD